MPHEELAATTVPPRPVSSSGRAFLALNYGWATPLSTLVAHVAYGPLLGAFYRVAG